jgi:hypothetical protein
MDFDFGSFFVGAMAGLALAYYIIHQIGRMIFTRLEAAVAAQVETKKKRIEMKVSKLGDIYYAHRADNDDFVCQGADLAELKRNFSARFPGHDGSVEGVSEETHAELVKQKQELSKTA